MQLSDQLAQQIVDCDFSALPQSTIHACKRSIMDGAAAILAGSRSPETAAFCDVARQTGGRQTATILGTGELTSPTMAAFCNGAASHALDFEDAFDPVPLHPNASLLPAAFALSQWAAPLSGRELIAAVAAGCDLACRIALSLRRPLESGGWYPPPILGAFGAVAACARLLGLAPPQILDAFSLLLLQNSCPGEIKHSARTVLRGVREAFPAQSAVQSVLLARQGVRGFEQPFEGEAGFFRLFAAGEYDPRVLLDSARGNQIERLSFKKWPCCRGTHAFIEAVYHIRATHAVEVDSIESIELSGAPIHRMLVQPLARKRQPDTLIDAKFSLPFTVALALLRPQITLDCFGAQCLRDPQVLKLTALTRFSEAAPTDCYGAASGSVRIVLNNGTQLNHGVHHALGDPRNPLSDADCGRNSSTARVVRSIRSAPPRQHSMRIGSCGWKRSPMLAPC